MRRSLFATILLWAMLALAAEPVKEPFQVIVVSAKERDSALSHLEAGPAQINLPETVTDLHSAMRLVYKWVNHVPRKRAGQSGDWIFFPRLDRANDDLSFQSGYAVKIGQRALMRWSLEARSDPNTGKVAQP